MAAQMRRLLYVPIIHTEADLGSMGQDISKRGIRTFGEPFWKRHEEAVFGFWGAVARYFDSLDASGLKVYQDGLVVDGDLGIEIVNQVRETGSKNYEIVAQLLQRGAILVRTEDENLVKEEHTLLLGVTRSTTSAEKLSALGKYKAVKDKLLKKRDRFIAERITETLREDETGVLFVGAYHNVMNFLPRDINVVQIKKVDKIQEYQRLLPFRNTHGKRLEELRRYLMAEIEG